MRNFIIQFHILIFLIDKFTSIIFIITKLQSIIFGSLYIKKKKDNIRI
jgi:hypothetical protein